MTFSYYEKIGDRIMNIDDEIPFEVPDNWSWCRGYSCFKGIESTKPQGEFFDYIDIDSIDNRLHRIKKPKHLLVSDAPSRANRSVKNGSGIKKVDNVSALNPPLPEPTCLDIICS